LVARLMIFWNLSRNEKPVIKEVDKMNNEIKIFEGNQIRSVWDNDKEEWYFSVVDVVGTLTDSKDPGAYWRKLKQRLKEEGSEVVTFCHGLKLKAADGKMRESDVADMQGIFRIIQSVPSPKAEPFKMWMAEVGKERLDEIVDPELTIERALETYLRKGYSREWINQRLQAIQVRKELTDSWQEHGVKEGLEYAILTNEISKAWSGMTTREYKDFKGLKKQNLRDNMSTTELILNMLAETATKDIANASNPQGLKENKKVAKRGGNVAKVAKETLEQETGKPVITTKNAIDFGRLISDVTKEIPN
jgi:prophage antirepressor